MAPAGVMKPLCPKTVTVSMACSTKKTTLSHPDQRGTRRAQNQAGTMPSQTPSTLRAKPTAPGRCRA